MSKLTEASASPSPSNPTSLGETYMSYKTGKQILSSTEIQDQGPKSYKITFAQVLTRYRPKKKSEKGKQRHVHYKHAEMERLRTMVSIHTHEEIPTPTPTTKLRLRPLLLSLTPGSDKNNGPRAISGPHKQGCCDTSGLIQGVYILHKKQHAARELDSDQLLSGRMRNPTGSEGTSGFPNDLRVKKQPPGSKRPQGPKYDLRGDRILPIERKNTMSPGPELECCVVSCRVVLFVMGVVEPSRDHVVEDWTHRPPE
ncbi:hypothetical protein DY000_02060878 [Brassica cretica]|uniref:Uncharacterized protein n=1 Tax=Brassica cretica TaxID=69181 RepID=A0ABQ7B1L4_BRACR|nr:hypothetical protein DY000_02060878 [Brassica cretica]